jgi:hypothetical protein
MTARNIRFVVFVTIHFCIALWGFLWMAERALERQDRICQEGCE